MGFIPISFYMLIRINMTEFIEDVIELRSCYNKIPGMEYKIEPCKEPSGRWPSCVRQVNANGDMILSEQDVKDMNQKGVVLLPVDQPITVKHGTRFDLSDPLQKAQWEAIKYSPMIAPERFSKDVNGNYLIDGSNPSIDIHNNPYSRYGVAELYIEHPGKLAKAKNDIRRLVHKAESLILEDSLDHMIMICRLFDRDMRNSNSNDVEGFLMTKAEKEPETIIKYYQTEESKIRLLLIMAQEKKVIDRRIDGLYYGDMKLGSTQDYVADMLKDNKELYENIKKETFPDMVVTPKNKK